MQAAQYFAREEYGDDRIASLHPIEVEDELLRIPGIRAAAVVGQPDAARGEIPVAFVETDAQFDAEQTLGKFTQEGTPNWQRFHALVGGAIAEMRLQYPNVRAYGEMVDLLWRDGNPEGAIALEEHWNDLGTLFTFSLLCAGMPTPRAISAIVSAGKLLS